MVGFQGLLPVLINEGQYHELCTPTNTTNTKIMYSMFDQSSYTLKYTVTNITNNYTTPCPAQSVKLELMFVVATSVINGGNLIVGPLTDISKFNSMSFHKQWCFWQQKVVFGAIIFVNHHFLSLIHPTQIIYLLNT